MSSARRTAAFLTVLLGGAGVLHFSRPAPFDGIVPRALPGAPRCYTSASGLTELGVAGLLAAPRTRRTGGFAAAALFVAVFPANLQMAYDLRDAPSRRRTLAVARLPLQGLLIAQALHVAAPGRRGPAADGTIGCASRRWYDTHHSGRTAWAVGTDPGPVR